MSPLRMLVMASLCAAVAPLLRHEAPSVEEVDAKVPPWPVHFQGRNLTPLPLSAREQGFLRRFPGVVARFTDGERDIVMRRVTRPTRQLHPAEDCYRGLGFTISASQIVRDRNGSAWRCFIAKRSGAAEEVCEQLSDREGRQWTDVSSWYWAATLRGADGPWLATTVAARVE